MSKHTIAWIPQPQHVHFTSGVYTLPRRPTIGLQDHRLVAAARRLADGLGGAPLGTACASAHDPITLRLDSSLRPDGYTLVIDENGVTAVGQSGPGIRAAVETLLQLVAQVSDRTLPCLLIEDWPAFALRGVYYDVTRGRVPLTERLVEQADLLSRFKINHLQHYVEHTFRFRAHPLIGAQASPLTAEDILTLDSACAGRDIELVPSLASFGHMQPVLSLPPYRHLAEDLGEGRYEDPSGNALPAYKRRLAWSLAPSNPDSYTFLESLYAEFLPLFRSTRFNACCDETYDLGLGQSYAQARRIGKGRLYLGHVLKLHALAKRYGKQLMIWGDIIHHYPELISRLPRDLVVLDWGYDHNTKFDRVEAFRKAGVPFIACPGTSAWVSLFPRLHEATASIQGYAAAARRHGAMGMLNTDWGDRGHFNFMELSWHGYLFGAEQAWNPDADSASFTNRFARLFLGSDVRAVADAITTLGDVTHTNVTNSYQSVWYHLFFAQPDDALFTDAAPRAGWVSRRGVLRQQQVTLNRALGEQTLARLIPVRRALEGARRAPGGDPHGILPYWCFAIDTISHAARRLTVLGSGGQNTRRGRQALADEMESLMTRFTRLWLARNRPSEMRNVLRQYRTCIRALRR